MAEVFIQPGAIDPMLTAPPTSWIRHVHKMIVRKSALLGWYELFGKTGVAWYGKHATITEDGDKAVPFALV
jgi:hypothetical protein